MPELPSRIDGEIVEASHMNEATIRSIQRYSSEANRDSLNPAPETGQPAWIEDIAQLQAWNGTVWVVVGGTGVYLGLNRGLALADMSPSAQAVWEPIGSQLSLGNSHLVPVWVTATASGSTLIDPGVGDAIYQMRIGISHNAGGDWTYSPASWGSVTESVRRQSWSVNGTSSIVTTNSDVRVVVEGLWSSGTKPLFTTAMLVASMQPSTGLT